jgi:hypothetical protein
LIVLTLVVAPGSGAWVVDTDPVCPERPESGSCVAVVVLPGEGGGPSCAGAILADAMTHRTSLGDTPGILFIRVVS